MVKLKKSTILITPVRKRRVTAVSGTKFLSKLAKYNFKISFRDLAKNHDKYTWE